MDDDTEADRAASAALRMIPDAAAVVLLVVRPIGGNGIAVETVSSAKFPVSGDDLRRWLRRASEQPTHGDGTPRQ